MIGVLWLAVSLFAQVTTQISKTPAEVALVGGEKPVSLQAATARPHTRNIRFIFIGVSMDSLQIDGERSAVRVKDASPRFEIALPPGVDADEVRLLRLKAKDGHRSVGHTSSLEHPFSKSDLVPIAVEIKDPAQPRAVSVKPTAPLKPGEYAILIDLRFYAFGLN